MRSAIQTFVGWIEQEMIAASAALPVPEPFVGKVVVQQCLVPSIQVSDQGVYLTFDWRGAAEIVMSEVSP